MKRKNKIIFFIFFSLLSISLVILSLNKNTLNEDVLSNYENLKLSNLNNSVLIYQGNSSEWDEHIREIGNVIYDEDKEEYLFFYSGHNGDYKENNVFVGMAYSKDGVEWKKYGKVLNLSSEDPYIIYYNDAFYMFFEDKEEVPFRRISLATSQDGRTWEVVKKGVINPSNFRFSWQSQDVSSPVIIQVDTGWVMVYEGRGFFNQGRFGYAYSEDLINWDKKSCPVFSGGSYWDHHVVPDDILKYNDTYIMTYHGYNTKIEEWQSGLALSNDLKNLETLTKDPISESNTVMLIKFENKIKFIEEDKEVKIYNF